MKAEMPLTDRDFAGIRKAVMATVEAQELRRRRFALGLQFAFAALVVVVGVWWVGSTQQPLTRPFAPLRDTLSLRGARETHVGPALVATSAETPRPRDPAIPRPHRHRHPAPKHEPVLAAASDANPIRLELATADPDIRIIWISNPTESR